MTTSKISGRIVKIAPPLQTKIDIYTELNTDDIKIGDYVFVIGSVLDNTNLDISNIYSNGYEVLYVDNSKNIITIKCDISLTKTEIDSFTNSYFYISTASVVYGEFNGGEFNGGTLGKVDEKHFIFNDARINNGQFLGGDFLQGEVKYTNTNNNGTIINYDKSYSNIVDNNAFKGYTEFVSGDISKIYDSVLDHQINGSDYNDITIYDNGIVEFSKFLPYNIENGMKILFKNGKSNTKIYTFKNINYADKRLELIPNVYKETYIDSNNVSVENNTIDVFKIETIYEAQIEIYTTNTIIDNVVINRSNIYGGEYTNIEMRGGDVYDGNISNSTLKSTKEVLTVHNGDISKSNTHNINFNGGTLNDSIWCGDSLYSINNIRDINSKLAFSISSEYESLIDVTKPVFVSYLKDSTTNTFLPMYDENVVDKKNILNYQEIDIAGIKDIVDIDGKKTRYFKTSLDYIENINYQYGKISQTNFNNGLMIDNTIVSGLLKGNNYKVYEPTIESAYDGTNKKLLTLLVYDDKFETNDLIEITNLTLKYNLDLVFDDDENTYTYEEIFGTSRIISIDEIFSVPSNYFKLFIELPKNHLDKIYKLQEEGVLVYVEKIYPNRDILITKNIFISGDIKAGYIDNKIIRKANLDNNTSDKVLVSNESYYKRVSSTNTVFTSDTIMYGVSGKNSIITNNTGITGNMSDTIIGNVLNYSDIKRGLLHNIQMESGTVTNAYIDKSIWNGGVYKNGFGLYSADSNRSGIADNNDVYEQMSAPSVVYVNKNKIQLAEPSTYQENYKIIFKDFDLYQDNNSLNNNVFTVTGRNDLSDVLYINNPDTKPYICVNDISHYIISKTNYYLVDKTYKRLINNNIIDNVVESYNIDSEIIDITLNSIDNELYIATSNNVIYSLKNGTLSVYSKSYTDIKSIFYVNSLIVVANNGKTIYYNNIDITFTNNSYENCCFINNPGNSNLYFYYTMSSSKIYRVLFNLTTNISFQNEVLVYDNITSIVDISGVITNTGVDLFIVDNLNGCYRIGDDFVIGNVVNKNLLTFSDNVYKAKPFDGKLFSIVDFNDNKMNSVIVETDFFVSESGFGNMYSTVKVEDVNNPTHFYYYDDKTNRIVYTGINGEYINDLVVDTTGYSVKQIVCGGNNTAYALMIKGYDYYIGRLFISNDILSLFIGKVQTDKAISNLFFDGSNLYFLYSTHTICRYAFNINTTDISNTTQYIFTDLYSIVDYYIRNNDMYVIMNENATTNHYVLNKTTLNDFGGLTTIIDNSSSILKSVFVKNNIVYVLNENGIVIIDENFACLYDKNLLYLPGTFDNIRFFDNNSFTTNYSYISKRYEFDELSLSNAIDSYSITEHDTDININDAKNLYVLSENVIRFNDDIIAGEYKIIRETPANGLYDPILFPEVILASSMNPMNPMTNVSKIVYTRQNNKGHVYFSELWFLYRISVVQVTDAGYNHANTVELDSDGHNRYREASITNYRTFYHYNSEKNYVVVKELVYDFSSIFDIIIDISIGGTTNFADTLMIMCNTGNVYIYVLDNTLSKLYTCTTPIAAGYNKIIPEQSMNNRFYLLSTNVMKYVSLSNFNSTLFTFDASFNSVNDRTILLDTGETIDDIFTTYTTYTTQYTAYSLCVRTNTRAFYSNWSINPGATVYQVQMPFIIDGVLLERPLFSRTNNSNFVYLYENEKIYRLDIRARNITTYNVTYLAKSPSYLYTFISIDGRYVSRQKSLNTTNSVINTSDKVVFNASITADISKIVPINDTIVYALMDDGTLYKIDFATSSYILVNVGYGNIVYRETNNTIVPNLVFKVTDICYYQTKLLINMEMLDGIKYYNDIFVLELNNTTNKNGIEFLYNYKPNLDDTVDTSILHPMDINGDVVATPSTNMIYLYESTVPNSTKFTTNFFENTNMITLSFYVNNTTSNYVNRINNFKTDYAFSDATTDYYIVTIPTFNNVVLNPSITGTIYPIDNSGTALPVSAVFTTVSPYTQASPLNTNQAYMLVDNTTTGGMINNDCVMLLNYSVNTTSVNTDNNYFVVSNSGTPYSDMTAPNILMTTPSINLLQSNEKKPDGSVLYSNGVCVVGESTNAIALASTSGSIKGLYLYPETFVIDNIINTETARVDTVDVFTIINLITNFSKYSNIYVEKEIMKLYKTIYNIATPFISARIINNSIINNGSDINTGGNSKTLYFMNSIWNNGAFTGSWNEPNRIDNNPVSKTSFFVNGSFKGDLHKGFFLGGDISSSTIYNGHMIANSNNINIDSNTIISTKRYDIVSMTIVDDDYMYLDIDTINEFNNKITTDILPGTIITIPNVFVSEKLFIADIQDLPLNVNGEKCVLISIPTDISTMIDMIDINSNVLIFSKNNVNFNNYFKVVEKNYNLSTNTIELVIETNIDVSKLTITGNNDIYLSLNEYFILNQNPNTKEYYIKIDKSHLLPYIDVVDDNKVMLHTNNFKQLFTTSFSSGFYDLVIKSDNIENAYLNNVTYIGKTIRNSVISKSDIVADTIYQSFIYSGNIKAKIMQLSHIMCVDKHGYLVDNQEYTTNIESDIVGDNIEFLSYSYDTMNDRICLTTNGVLDDIRKYSFIGVRGFSGNNSARLGANFSVVHRIEDISNDGNIVYIKNNVFGDIDAPTLNIVNQTVQLRDTSGQNLRAKSADILQLTDYTFKTSVSFEETPESNTWVVLNDNSGTGCDILLVEDGFEIIPNTNQTLPQKVTIYQKLSVEYSLKEWSEIFISDISTNIDVTYDLFDKDKNTLLSLPWTGAISDTINFYANNNNSVDISDEDIVYFAIHINIIDENIHGFLSKVFLDSILNKINFTNDVNLNYGYMSNSSISLVNNNFNKGTIETVWNSGIFNDGVFNGKWFGSNPYVSYLDTYDVIDKKINGLPNILNNKKVYVKFIESNIDGVLSQIFTPMYGIVINNTIDISSIINIIDGRYDITIYDIDNKNIEFGSDANNPAINNTTSIKFDVPNSKNGMLISNYLKSDIYDSFVIDLSYDTTIQNNISPLLSFINNETMVGVRIFYSKVLDKIVFVDEYKNVIPTNEIVLINNSGVVEINNNNRITYTKGSNTIDFDLNYIGRTAFRINDKYDYSNYESTINNIDIKGIKNGVTKNITNFDFLYQDKFISADCALNNDDKTYAFDNSIHRTNKFFIGEIQHINPLIDFTLVNEKPGSIIYLTSTVDLSTYKNKYSLSLESIDVDGTYYKIDVVERFLSGVDGDTPVINKLYTTGNIRYCDRTHIVLSKDTIYINGVKSGNFISLNRNIIQYTDSTKITLGMLDYYPPNIPITPSITGYITDINVWDNKSYSDVYDIYLTDVLPKSNLSINRTTPYYNINDNYSSLNLTDKVEIDDKYYTNLNGNNNIEWLKMTPSSRLAFDSPLEVKQLALTNMSDFQFFGKKYNTKNNGELVINITRNGYIFFDVFQIINQQTQQPTNYIAQSSLPCIDFEESNDDLYKPFVNMDAIVANTNLPGDSSKEYYAGVIDKPTYAVIVYYFGNYPSTTLNVNEEIYRVYFDKTTSTISTYISNVPSNSTQKLFGLVRKDGVKVFVKDTKYNFEKYSSANPDAIYNSNRVKINDKVINNKIIISYQPQISNDIMDESLIAQKLYTHDYSNLVKTNKISFLGNSYDYSVRNYTVSEYSYMTSAPTILYTKKTFNGELYDVDKSSVSVARMSYFNGGTYSSDVWYNGVFVRGEITKNNFIWKFGLKLNGKIHTSSSLLKNYAHWLGGYCEGSNDIGLLENVVWYRGKHSGGMFRKGYIFAYNYDMDVIVNDTTSGVPSTLGYTVFDKMVIYSDITKTQKNIYTDIFVADKKIQLVPNTEYELSVPIDGDNIPTIGVDISSLLSADFNKIKTVKYEYTNGDGKYITISVNKIDKQESPVTNKMIVSVRFNSGNINNIQFLTSDINAITHTTITNYKLMGYKTVTPNIDNTLLEDFNTIWNSGMVSNKNEYLNYLSPYTKTYNVSGTTITLPLVDTTILGCLWLSGAFDGGIVANTFWNSIDVSSDISSSTTNLSEIKHRHLYNGDASIFLSGKMINSAWYGGYVNNTAGTKQNVVFGDILSNYQIYKINDDYKTPNDFIGYVKSTLPAAYKTVLGKKIFTGYYLTNDSTISNSQIEYNRVTSQNNPDGIMSVYIHRGDVSNSIIQHSVIQSYDMDNVNSYDMTDPTKYVKTTDSHIFMSQINGLRFETSATSSAVVTLHLTTPNSIVYQSEWNYGIWDIIQNISSNGGIDSGVTTDRYITDALISRSIWNTGEFHGGTMNNSIWRSGFNKSIKYSNAIQTDVAINDLSLQVANDVTTHKAYTTYNDNLDNFDITDSDVRYVGHVDNCASIFFNGRMNGCIWHGGVFKRGMFTDKTYINATKTFDTVDEPINRTDFIQKAVFTRGIIQGGYFGKYIIKNSSNAALPADISTYILSYSATKMTDNNTMLGTNDITPDTYSVFLTRNNIRVNTGNYITNITTPRQNYPYFCVINCLMSGGHLYNDTTSPNIDSVLFNTYSRAGGAYSTNQPDSYVFENGLGNYITIYPGNPYVSNNGNININVSVWSNNQDISWRHNMNNLSNTSDVYVNYYYYGDNTNIPIYSISIAQGDGSILLGNMYGEPIYRNEVVVVPNNQFNDVDFENIDFKI